MKPLSVGTVAGLLFTYALIQGTSAVVDLNGAVKYDAGTCNPGSVVMTVAACTSDVPCGSGSGVRSGTLCGTDSNWKTNIDGLFTGPYMVISEFTGSTTCAAASVTAATAYAADGACHPIGTKYFKVDAGGGAGAAAGNSNGKPTTISTYIDPQCTSPDPNTADVEVNAAKLATTGCFASGSNSKEYIVENWPGTLDVSGVYTASGCSAGTATKLKFSLPSNAGQCGQYTGCSSNAITLTDCTTVNGYKSYMKTAFGSTPYLIKEVYTGGACATRGAITAYAADGVCYADGANSFKVVSTSAGVTLQTWTSDTQCTPNANTDVDVLTSDLVSNACVSSGTAKYYMGGSWVMSIVAAYDESVCALTPSKLSLSITPTCTASTTCSLTTSQSDSSKKGYKLPGCAKINNYFSAIDKAFGITPYVVQESYTACGGSLTGVTAYVADAQCHLSADATSSYKVTYTAGVTGATVQVKIETFANVNCGSSGAVTPVTVTASDLGTACSTDFKKTYVGGLGTKFTAVTTYSDNTCTTPVQTVFSSPAGTCTTGSCSAAGGGLYTKQVCMTNADYAAHLVTVFGTTLRLVTDIYEPTSSSQCGTRQGIVAYVGDSTCHATVDGKSFKVKHLATTAAAVTISTFPSSDCTLTEKKVDIAASSLATASPCDNTNSMKYSVGGSFVLAAKTSFDSGICSNALGFISIAPGTCTSDTTCTSGTGVLCTSDTGYKLAFASAFGATPHVIVSKFTGAVCTSSALTSINAYGADEKCHMISSSPAKYYKGVISAGGSTTTITFYSNSDCSTPLSGTGNDPVVVGPTQKDLNVGSVSGCDGLTSATRYETSVSWPASKKALTVSDGSDCTKAMGFVSIAATIAAASGTGTNNDCTADTDCDSGAGAICTTNFNYDSALAAKFGATPYVTIATFSQASCPWSALSTVSAYAADGKCHKIDTNAYYKVTAVAFGGGTSNAKIVGYSDSTCSTADTTLGIDFDVTKSLLTTTSGCATSGSASTQYKLSANWPTAMNVAGVGTYAITTCSGAPSKLTFTDVVAASANCGVATTMCTAAKALADCSNSTSYKKYLDTAFGTVPYVIKEAYTGTGCPSSTRGAITAYAADGTCYEDGAGSFKVVATPIGISIKTWSAVKDCSAASPGDASVTAANLVSNACVSNAARYYMGGSWALASNAVYDDANCALTPSKLSILVAPTCTAPTGAAACVPTPSATDATKIGYYAPGCAKAGPYFPAIDKAFGMTTYVVQESYTGSNCALLAGVTAYVADAQCHLNADATSSYNVTYDPASNATTAVKIDMFATLDCSTTATTTTSIPPASITAKTCSTDNTKTYIGGLASKLTAVTTYSDKACTVPVQTVFSSTATTCAASAATACTAVGTLFTKTACTNATSDYTVVLNNVFGTTRRLVTDIYEAKGTNKCGTRQGIVAYVGDDTCHATLDATTFFKVTLGSSNTATDASLSTFSDKNCTTGEKKLPIAAANLAAGSLCDGTNSMKFSIGGTEPATEAPATDAPTPAPTTAVSTGSGKSAAVSSFSVSIFGLLASILGALAVLLN